MLFSNRKRGSQKGFTFTEILIVLAIIAGVTVLVLSQAGTVIAGGAVDRAASDIRSLVSASQRYRATRSNYSGLTIQILSQRSLLPEHLIDATTPADSGMGLNPWGGDYYVAPALGTGTLNQRVIVGLTAVPFDLALSLTDAIGERTACSATATPLPGPAVATCPDGGASDMALTTGYTTATGWATTGTVTWAHSFR